jgi:heme/copper-type cytochrome/quinol oxidase subunit 2
MKKYIKTYTLAILVVASVVLFGCTQHPEPLPVPAEKDKPVVEQQEQVQVVVEEPASEPEAVEQGPATEVKEFEIIARQFNFEPETIEVNEGDTVRLKMRTIDVAHGFVLDAFDIDERLNPGDEVVVEFIADKTGDFDFYCNVPCGSGHSKMRGSLIVR